MESPTPKDRSKLRWLIAAISGLVVLGFVLPLFFSRDARTSHFVSARSKRFRTCRTLPDAEHVAPFTRGFSDGSWVAAVSEHSCSSGAGFDATVFYDSRGIIRVDRSHHFCGVEGLESELRQVAATSLADFYRGLQQCQLTQLP